MEAATILLGRLRTSGTFEGDHFLFDKEGLHSKEQAATFCGNSTPMKTCNDDLKDESEIVVVSLPSLSLQHKESIAEQTGSDRKQVEDQAASLLARRLVWANQKEVSSEAPASANSPDEDAPFQADSLEQLRVSLIKNLNDSFAVLCDCRLRAYGTFLARYGISLAKNQAEDLQSGVLAVEQKLNTVLDIGSRVATRKIDFAFEHDDNFDALLDEDEENDRDTENDLDSIPLTLKVTLMLEIPSLSDKVDVIRVPLGIPGHGKVKRSSNASSVLQVDLDTRKLLSDMILNASRVVGAVVEAAQTSSLVPESKLCRSSSFLAMPPPMPKGRPSTSQKGTGRLRGLDLLSCAASELPIVSPDIRGRMSSSIPSIPILDLVPDDKGVNQDGQGPEEGAEQDVLLLSADECATIVDDIFGGMDDAILSPPNTKKQKLGM